jgi:hypothetical protein
MAFLERVLQKYVMKDDHIIPLAMRMTRMWEYTGPVDPDQVSLEEMPDDEV